MVPDPTNQNQPTNSGITGAVTTIADKLSPLCLAAVVLAGFFGYLTYVSLREERQEMHMRQMKLIELTTACYDRHEDRRDE